MGQEIPRRGACLLRFTNYAFQSFVGQCLELRRARDEDFLTYLVWMGTKRIIRPHFFFNFDRKIIDPEMQKGNYKNGSLLLFLRERCAAGGLFTSPVSFLKETERSRWRLLRGPVDKIEAPAGYLSEPRSIATGSTATGRATRPPKKARPSNKLSTILFDSSIG